ncbi:MAG: multiheme c-type cytochrome [Gemmatimonadota bacterium]|nr:multiheme c-type cytochrome [Gemmatimonadota bacterium]MDH5757958.1 multiheme c-type cytochrome [Gemmatimonadota bacterium]
MRIVDVVVCMAGLAGAASVDAQQAGGRCDLCHAELEFLRQHTETLEEASALLVPSVGQRGTAHDERGCADCHSGYRRYPHPGTAATASCAECHPDPATEWSGGVHAVDAAAECASCHGVHDVASSAGLGETPGLREMNGACVSCHFEPRMPASDPHADSVACTACHEAHGTRSPGDPEAGVHPLNQHATCGTCHDQVAAEWERDAHREAVNETSGPPDGGTSLDEFDLGHPPAAPPGCTACHGAHGMPAVSGDGAVFGRSVVAACSGCHEEYGESFADSYHGQASTLGSGRAATCQACHTAHSIHATEDPRSSVSEENLLKTCRACHPGAAVNFAGFQPHADHADRERYPHVYWSYRFMTALLVGVFTVFGLHTALWLFRVTLDGVRLMRAGTGTREDRS